MKSLQELKVILLLIKKIIEYNCILRVQFDDLHDNSYFCYVIGMLLLDMKAVVTMKKRTYITLS